MGAVIQKIPKNTSNFPAMANVEEAIRQTLAAHKVVIYSKSYCPYCTMAKEQFTKLSVPYHVIEIENLPECQAIQDVLGQMTGARSVPRCFIDGEFIGGGTDVKKLYDEGKLQKYFS